MSGEYARRVRFRDRGKYFLKVAHAVSDWRRQSNYKKNIFSRVLDGGRGGDNILLGTFWLLTLHSEWKMLVLLFEQVMTKIYWSTAIFFSLKMLCCYESLKFHPCSKCHDVNSWNELSHRHKTLQLWSHVILKFGLKTARAAYRDERRDVQVLAEGTRSINKVDWSTRKSQEKK